MTNEDAEQQIAHDGPADLGHEDRTRGQELAAQQQRLEGLRVLAEKFRLLRERESQLEAELIVAEATRKTASPKAGLDLDPAKAAEIEAALDRQRGLQSEYDRLEQRQYGRGGEELASELAQLREGRDALNAWLEPPRALRRPPLHPLIHAIVAAAAVACTVASLVIHPMFLVLLFPLGLPLALVVWSRQDLAWLRLGAERRFKATGLAPPTAWKAPAVGERLSEIAESADLVAVQMEELARSEEMEESDPQLLALAADLAQAELRLEAILADAGLSADSIDPELEQWLEATRQILRWREELQEVRAERIAIRAETDDGREELFRYLSRHGEAPPEGRADLDALAAGLARLTGQSPEQPGSG